MSEASTMHASPIRPLSGLSQFRGRFTIVTLLFLSVLFGLLGYTIATIQKEQSEALLIDLAGRQRMLIQKHMNEVFYASQQVPADYTSTRELIRSTLASLMEGGSVVLDPETGQRQVIPSAPTEKIFNKLREQEKSFDNLAKLANYFLSLQPEEPEFSQHLQILRDQTSNLIDIADEAVKLFEVQASARVGTMVKWETLIALLVGLMGLLFIVRDIRDARRLDHEIAERKRAEDNLLSTERMYRQILDSISDMVFMKDQNFRMIWGNKAFRSYYNMTNEQLRGILDSPFNKPEFTKDYNKDDAYVLNKGEVLDIPEEPVTRYDGQIRYFHTIKAPLLGESGEVMKLVGVARDITEGKEDKDALKESEERFRLLNEAIPQQVWTAGPDGSLDYVNQRALQYFDCSFEEILGQGWQQFLHPDDLPGCLEGWDKARATNQPFEIEFRLLRAKDHSFRWHLGRALPLVNPNGQVRKWFGTNTDITQLKQLENQVRQTQKMEAMGTLAGGIAHDFNNILSAITGYAELATFNSRGNNAAQRNLEEVLVAGQRAKELVQRILAFSRQSEHERQPIELQAVVKEVCKFLRASLPATIDIRQTFMEGPSAILGDPIQMHQVVMNLCANAEHAMRKEGGLLELKVDRVSGATHDQETPTLPTAGSFIRLTIRDTGAGMTPEVTQRIFDPFFTTKEVGEGTGMGLAVVHGIVTSHGGCIDVQSEPGQGTTFTIDFPEIEAKSTQGETNPLGQEFLMGHGHILFVEDEESLARLGEEAMRGLGYDVTVRTSSLEALEAFRADPFRFDVIVTDQTMPKMTGEALSRELLQIRSDVPIILCTGFSHSMTQEKAKAMGIRAFLLKPLLIKGLAQTLQEVLNIKNI
jgi:PAS domain S-box-containing protein